MSEDQEIEGCSLCESTEVIDRIAGTTLPICAICLSALTTPDSFGGRWFRKYARALRRLIIVDGIDAKEPWTTDTFKAHVRKATAKYRGTEDGRQKVRARDAVATALKSGTLIRPERCPRCKRKPEPTSNGRSRIQFHHTKGYARENWLVGEWLCQWCHNDDDMPAAPSTGRRRH